MTTIRQCANGAWQVTIRRSILPKPHYATFDIEEETRHYSCCLEQLLDRGVIPEGLQQARESEMTVGLSCYE